MEEKDKYDLLTEKYDSLLKSLLPNLTEKNVDVALANVNSLAQLQQPDIIGCTGNVNRILGMTSDQERVVYGGPSNLSFYQSKPYEEVHTEVSKSVDKAKRRYERFRASRLSPDLDISTLVFDKTELENNLRHARKLLEDLVSLKPKLAV